MKYNSIGEYFYRMSNRCLALVLLPVTLLLAAYTSNQYFFSGLPWLIVDEGLLVKMTAGVAVLIIFLSAIIVWMSHPKLKALSKDPSLGNRIMGYVPIVTLRFRMLSLMLFIIGSGIFLTGSLMFFFLMSIPVFQLLIYWPVASRMAKDLRLKFEEREILKNKSLGV